MARHCEPFFLGACDNQRCAPGYQSSRMLKTRYIGLQPLFTCGQVCFFFG